ncbi:hypothetical protein COT52_00660 [candidate division WWE3 bacterium CG08_land_8_20_14_0_20_43_13]|uniref:Uncharacterized protein n=1 Tax=candidate division WWE3 bacterium CG08_land_8_20_14_0_20_43_13 TaxID=1975087 RepID=A0A2H0XA61_UNCKA|nr:MAG: hypothetical protein COT52_00660 [candidate division WWE3 bacterium CG08_land_8_20_14_0_20_43_13]
MSDQPDWVKYGQHTSLAWRRSIRPYLVDSEKKKYTILGLTLSSLIIFGWFAIKPAAITVISLLTQIKQYREINQALDKKSNAITQAREDYLSKRQYLKSIEDAIPTNQASSKLLNTLEEIAANNLCQIGRISFSKDTSQKNIGKIELMKLELLATGTKDNIFNFIKGIETNERIFQIEALRLTSKEDTKTEQEYLIANLKLKTYYYNDE